MQPIRHLSYLFLCLLLVSCGYTTRYQEAQATIAIADSLDQHEHLLYPDTAALLQAIRTLSIILSADSLHTTNSAKPTTTSDAISVLTIKSPKLQRTISLPTARRLMTLSIAGVSTPAWRI